MYKRLLVTLDGSGFRECVFEKFRRSASVSIGRTDVDRLITGEQEDQIRNLTRRVSAGLEVLDFAGRQELLRLPVEKVFYDRQKLEIQTIIPLNDQLHPLHREVKERVIFNSPSPVSIPCQARAGVRGRLQLSPERGERTPALTTMIEQDPLWSGQTLLTASCMHIYF